MGVLTTTAKASLRAAERAKKAKALAKKKAAKKTPKKAVTKKPVTKPSKGKGKKAAGLMAAGGAAALASKGKNNGKAKAAQKKRVGRTAKELKKLGY